MCFHKCGDQTECAYNKLTVERLAYQAGAWCIQFAVAVYSSQPRYTVRSRGIQIAVEVIGRVLIAPYLFFN